MDGKLNVDPARTGEAELDKVAPGASWSGAWHCRPSYLP